jgi:hypothetical protein
MRHPQPARFFIKLLAILPAALIALLILKDGVDFPFQDQWVIAPFFNKLAHGTLTFNDLFALLNEHRQFFPNVFFVALGWLTHWNVKIEMCVTFLLACVISFNIFFRERLNFFAHPVLQLAQRRTTRLLCAHRLPDDVPDNRAFRSPEFAKKVSALDVPGDARDVFLRERDSLLGARVARAGSVNVVARDQSEEVVAARVVRRLRVQPRNLFSRLS